MAQTSKTNIWIDGTQAGATYRELKKEVNLLNREIRDLPRNSEQYNAKVKDLAKANEAVRAHRKSISGIGDSYKEAKQGLGSMVKQFAPLAVGVGAITTVVNGITGAFSSWYETNVRMSSSLSSLKSLTNASKEDMVFYKEEAIRMGSETTKSATEVVEAMKLIGSAKPELLKNRQALADMTETTIVFAEAAEISMEEAAQAMAGGMNQFEEGVKSADKFANAYAAGSQAGAANIKNISDTIDKSGASMKGYNVTIEQGIGLTETLAEKNIKGAEAGTQLRNILTKMEGLAGLSPEAVERAQAMGVNIELVMDKTVPFNQRLEEMAKITGDVVTMQKVFGLENMNAARTILENTDKVQMYTDAVTGTNTAYEQQAINNDNMEGDLKALGSAWEGLALTMGGGEIFRPIVQAGTDFLNWTTDTITALKNWDTDALELSLLRMTDAFFELIPGMGDVLDQAIRMREITKEVIESVRQEADEVVVLTESIIKNNEALNKSNLSEKEAAELRAENQEIIDVLNERYPELTENIDLHHASSEEMNKLQKKINDTLVEQAISAAKAAEAERLLNEIVEKTIELQYQRQENTEKGFMDGFLPNASKIYKAYQTTSIENDIRKTEEQYKNLDNTMAGVEERLNGMNLDWGTEFKVNEKLVDDALKNLELKQKQFQNATTDMARNVIKSEIEGLEKVVKTGNDNQKNQLRGILDSMKETEEQAEEAAEKQVAASKKAAKAYEKLKDELNKVTEALTQMQEDFDYTKRVNAFEEGLEKELFILEHNIQKKYEKEIEAAQELANKKGEIGIKGQEQLNALIVLMDQELAYETTQIKNKFAKKSKDELYELDKQRNLEFLKQEESYEQAVVDLKLSKATMLVEASRELGGIAHEEALKDLEAALIKEEKLKYKKEMVALQKKQADFEINDAEFKLRKEQLEKEHANRIKKIHSNTNEELAQLSLARFETLLNNASTAVNMIDEAMEVMYQARLARIQDEEAQAIKSYEDQAKAKGESESEMQQGIREVQAKYEAERNKIKNEQAQKDKAAAIFNSIISTFTAVSQALPNIPLSIAAGIMGGLQTTKIIATPVPQYYEGGYTSVIGAQDGKTYKAKNPSRPSAGWMRGGPRLVLTNEHEPEYFVPDSLFKKDVRVANHVAAIEAIRVNQFAQGGYTQPPNGGGMSDDQLIKWLQANMAATMALTRQIPNMGVKLDDGSLESIRDRTDEINNLYA